MTKSTDGFTAKLFRHGRCQAVRLPKEFRFEGTKVRVRREGPAVILEPMGVEPLVVAAIWAEIDALRGDETLFLPPDFDGAPTSLPPS